MAVEKGELGLQGRVVLVVEDEYYLAQDIVEALARHGTEVLGPVPTPREALALAGAAKRLDAAIIDINLRGESIFSVADALVERGTPFVFATGYESDVLPLRFLRIPRWEKPFVTEKLIATLIDLLPEGR